MKLYLGGIIPYFEFQRQVRWPSGMKALERSISMVWLRRRFTLKLES